MELFKFREFLEFLRLDILHHGRAEYGGSQDLLVVFVAQGSDKETMATWWCLGCATLNVNDLYMFFSIWPSKHSLEFVWGTFESIWCFKKKNAFQADSNRELYLGAATFTCCSLSPYQRVPCLKLMSSRPKRKLSCLPDINHHQCTCATIDGSELRITNWH